MTRQVARKGLVYIVAAFLSTLAIEAVVYLKIANEPIPMPQKIGLFFMSVILSWLIVILATRR